MAAADLIDGQTLHLGVFQVGIVELNLHHLDFRMLRQNLLQHLRGIVEGDTNVADFSLVFQLLRHLEGVAFSKLLILIGIQGVHQVKIKITGPCNFQLAFKEGADLLLSLKKGAAQFIG